MKSSNIRQWRCVTASCAMLLLLGSPVTAAASEKDSIETLSAGAAVVLEADLSKNNQELALLTLDTVKPEPKKEKDSGLVMADVNDSVNVRSEADEDAEKVGKLYKDCGGEILEQNEGWTKIQSGDVVGWVKDEYLVFGQDAEKLASDVGHLVADVQADALRVRKDKSEEADFYGVVTANEKIDVVESDGDWVAVDYEGSVGYISAEYAKVEFLLDEGETMQAIQAREQKEAEEKAKRMQNRGAVPSDASDVELLAALIQCEAGGESYEGQLAVAAVVMNRVRSGAYPNTVSGVIYASGQFTPALNGKVAARVEKGSKASCLQAAQEAINGASNIGGATHFRRAGQRQGMVIGNHVFW